LFTAPPRVSALLEDIGYLSRSLHETWTESFFLFCLYAGSLVPVLRELFPLLRHHELADRQPDPDPLLGPVLVFLPRFLSGGMHKAMSKTLTGAEPEPRLLASIFIILSVLLIGWDLLFVNKGRGRKEKTDG
jgi:hypothetical protein